MEEEVEKKEEVKPLPEKQPERKKKYVVTLIRKDFAVVVDDKNNGSRIPLTGENKNIKVGDVIYK